MEIKIKTLIMILAILFGVLVYNLSHGQEITAAWIQQQTAYQQRVWDLRDRDRKGEKGLIKEIYGIEKKIRGLGEQIEERIKEINEPPAR